ncbi:MAG: type 4a pilus biogenesis protein PilO [Gemmatimonadales bacterium]
MASVIPQDRRGQILLLLTVVAVVAGYVLWKGFAPAGIDGITQYQLRRDSIQSQVDTLTAQVRRSKADVQHGTVGLLETRLAQFRANLELMRQLVPASTEVPNLLDDISSRAKMRGATVADFTPQGLESGSPFDTQKARFTVTGQFDQVGEFLSDIASLPRIVVPFDIKIDRQTGPGTDTTQGRTMLRVGFQIRTFVKTPAGSEGAAPAAPAPAHAPPRAGGDHE